MAAGYQAARFRRGISAAALAMALAVGAPALAQSTATR
jgi:hypothetical protein